MRNLPHKHPFLPLRCMVVMGILFFGHTSALQAQVVSLNSVYISSGSGTVVNLDTLRTDNSSTLANASTFTLASIINAGVLQGSGTYNIRNLFTNTGTFTANSSLVNFYGDISQGIPALTFNNLTASGTGSTKTAIGNIAVNGILTIGTGDTIDLVTNTLTGTIASTSGAGMLKTQNTSTTPIPVNKAWSGIVNYSSSSSQTIVYGNYNDLTASGGNRGLDNNGTIGIAGTFTPGGGAYTIVGSTIDFNGGSTQTIPAFTYNNITLTGANTKNVGGTINVRADLTLGANTTLALGSNNIRLKSDSTYTARLATVPSSASITYGAGRFIADRYVKGRRKYRLMTSPVTTHANGTLTSGEEAYSIWGNWQNQGNNSTPNVGTFITGGNSGDGFDTQTSNASLFTYNSAGRVFVGFTTANGKNTKYTPLKAGIPYYMFVWGDRTNSPITSSPYKTVLTATGTVLTGDQVYNTGSTIPLSNTVGGYTMIGNPYASAIDWAAISRTNLADTYWGWDPNLNSTGGYVTVNTSGTVTLIAPYSGSVGLNQYIQSGQGFFVKTTATSPTLTIHETDKVSDFNGNAFRTTANNLPLIAVNLFYDDPVLGGTLMDGTLAAFDPSYSNGIGKEDASKIFAPNEGMAIKSGSDFLSIDARKMPLGGDILFLHTVGLKKPQYRLQVFANNMDSSTLEPYLVDTYLNTSRLLSFTDTNHINFSIDAAVAASSKSNRFHILFRDPGALSQFITSISATKQNGTVAVEWKVINENAVQKYELERASSGSTFTPIGETMAAGFSTYQWFDNSPASGVNQYRVRVIARDGSTSFSRTVSVNMGEVKPGIKIFPNPIQDHQIQMGLLYLDGGKYTVQLFNAKGQLVQQKDFYHEGGNSTQIIPLNNQLPAGMYFLRVGNNLTTFKQQIIIQ